MMYVNMDYEYNEKCLVIIGFLLPIYKFLQPTSVFLRSFIYYSHIELTHFLAYDNKFFKMFFFLTLYAYKKGPKNIQLTSCIFINMPFVFATFNLFFVPYSLPP